MVKNNLTYVLFTHGWDGFPIAFHLKQEGLDVIVGQIDSKKELGQDDDEEPKDKEIRLSQYDGLLEKMPAKKLISALKKVSDKENYFIYFDQNNLFKYAEELLEAGFTKGIFPTEEDFEFEKDREKAMQFVKDNYPDIKIIPHEEFSKADEAIEFLKDNTDKVYVLQSKGDSVATMVPSTDDPIQSNQQLTNNLEKFKSEYDSGGLILKQKLINPVEITPQMVFWNGQAVFTDIDIETKNMGDGQNNGPQCGCGSNLIIKTNLEAKINKIAFPQIVHEMAQNHTGLFVWDLSIFVMPDGMYFGEYCANRFGYDSLMTEMTMSKGAGKYFESIVAGENPLEDTFGAAVRVFNLNKKADTEVSWPEDIKDFVWMYEIKENDGKMVSLGDCWDLGVITSSGNEIGETVDALYDNVDQFSFKERYVKSKYDFLDEYPTSIIHRYSETNGKLFDAPQFDKKHGKFEKDLKKMDEKHSTDMSALRQEMNTTLTSAVKETLKSIFNESDEEEQTSTDTL
jgi:hypothetical protein